jgi:hypothetical protein
LPFQNRKPKIGLFHYQRGCLNWLLSQGGATRPGAKQSAGNSRVPVISSTWIHAKEIV